MSTPKFEVGERVVHWTGEMGTIKELIRFEAVQRLVIRFPDGKEAWSDLDGNTINGSEPCIRKLTPLESLL